MLRMYINSLRMIWVGVVLFYRREDFHFTEIRASESVARCPLSLSQPLGSQRPSVTCDMAIYHQLTAKRSASRSFR